MIKRKRHLEMLLEKIPHILDPILNLNSTLTPAPIAAEVLWSARSMGILRRGA